MTNTLDFARSIDFSQSYFNDSLSYSFIENPSKDLLQSYEDSFSYSPTVPLIITKTDQIYLGNSVPVYQSETASTYIPSIAMLGLEEQSLVLSDQSQGQVQQLPPQWTHVTSYSEERDVLVIKPEERTEEQLYEEGMKRELITPRKINTDNDLTQLENDLMKSPFQPSRAHRKPKPKPTPVPTPTPPTLEPEPKKKTEPKPESEWNLYYYIVIALIFIIINVGIVFFMWYFMFK
jgi:hypothetical protein